MFNIVLIVAIVFTLLVYLRKRVKNTPPKERKSLAFKLGFAGLFGLVLLLVSTGRLHWFGAFVAALVPIVRFALPWLFRLYPLYRRHKQSQSSAPAASNAAMDIDEALKILDLKADYNKADVIETHRKLIQKLHPDRGGNDYLAAKLNQAKDLLLEKFK